LQSTTHCAGWRSGKDRPAALMAASAYSGDVERGFRGC
jgi:hypothetical protein